MLFHVNPFVRLVAVTKGRSAHDIETLISEGCVWFGENRLNEITEKWPPLKEKYPHIKLQFIGHIQSNKAENIVKLCDSIVSLDRPSIIHNIAKAHQKYSKPMEFLIQVNCGREPQKGGVLEENLHSLLDLCMACALPITGLMTIPPADQDPTPYFKQLKALCIRHKLFECSMGMSNDYSLAIDLGATQVRIGRALFSSLKTLSLSD
ncbi:MAG: YggS family pyridoxal phosphate-dependent enzyme [Alphaproteobacteria bacterium]|nr:YggS family pyridoxal phosphate-dependent enzyme [Alphaproteobacteria bacterium]